VSTHDVRSAENGAGRAWLLVTRREVLSRLTDKAFLIGTVVTVALIAGYLGFIAWSDQRTDDFTVVATPETYAMAQAVADGAPDVDENVRVTAEEVADPDAARAALADEEADAWLARGDDGFVLTYESSSDGDLDLVVATVVREVVLADNAAAVGASVEELQAGAQVETELLRGDAERAGLASAVGFAFAFLFYLASIMFGMQLANSVVEEKQNRIVEIIAAAIPVRHLLAGKVLGNTVLALLQVLVYVAVGLVGMSFTQYSSMVPSLSGPSLWFIAFFAAGFIALSCLWAVAGALASRTEDLQNTASPLTMLLVVVFIGALSVDGKAEVIASFVPPISAILMPKRILAGGVEWWEPALALGLLGVAAAVLVVLGERLYRRALLQTGGRVTLRQAWSAPE
jgi:ABC-2 type transport system permease protein